MRTHELQVPAHRLPEAVGRVLEGGGMVDAAFAAGPPGAREMRYVCATPGGDVLLRCEGRDGAVPTLVERLPHLAWDEREAHDLYGVVVEGHEPMRPLVDHPGDPDAWTTPVEGEDVHQVAVGPIHAGIIESGHFRFHTVGERVIHLDARLFHKHRGLERRAEGLPAADALEVIRRACGACAVANALAAAHAMEQAAGLRPDAAMRRARTLLLELERLYNHLNDIGQVCAGVGLAPGAMEFAALKERAHRVNHALAGHRFLFGAVALARSELVVNGEGAADARRLLAELAVDARAAWRDLAADPSLRDRTRDTGVLTPAAAARLGVRGPAARASGLAVDARTRDTRLSYEGFRPAAGSGEGDVAARLEMRAIELEDVFARVDGLLDGPLATGRAEVAGEGGPHGTGRVEGPRGESLCAVELRDGTVRRVHLRTASYANWPAVAHAAAGAILPDFPLVNKSFELCYACVDR